jgi:hypothetical protein
MKKWFANRPFHASFANQTSALQSLRVNESQPSRKKRGREACDWADGNCHGISNHASNRESRQREKGSNTRKPLETLVTSVSGVLQSLIGLIKASPGDQNLSKPASACDII